MNHLIQAKELADEVERLAIDAARYRWLRSSPHAQNVLLNGDMLQGASLDDICDSYMPTAQSIPPTWINGDEPRRLVNAEAIEKIDVSTQFNCQWQSCHAIEVCTSLKKCKNSFE